MDLAEVHEELVFDLREAASTVSTGVPARELGDLFDELSDKLEALGLCHLLEFGDVDLFRMNLVRSAQARRYFLGRMRAEGTVDDRHLALSRTRAVFAALAAGDLSTAREVVARSIEIFDPRWEYEDDHCYYLALHTLIRGEVPDGALFARFERVLEGVESPRLHVVRSLSLRDVDGFAASLIELLEAEQKEIDEARESAAVHEGDVLHWPNSFVSIEALGLLRLARTLGLDVDNVDEAPPLPRCPSIARDALDDIALDDLFEEIERLG